MIFCALLWGSAFPVIKHVYGHWAKIGIEPTVAMILLFAGVRFSIAGGGLLFCGKSLRAELRQTSWGLLLGFALTQTFIQYVFFYQAVAISSASLTALLVATGSFWWMLLSPLLQKSPWPSGAQWCGLLIGGVGVGLAVYAPGAGAGSPLIGTILMLVATGSGAVAVIIFQKIKPTMSAVNATGISLLTGGLALLAAGVSDIASIPEMFTAPVIVGTLWLAIVSATAFSLWNHLTTVFPVTLLASYRFLIPVCGVLEAQFFLRGESAGWGLLVGGALVIASMLIAQRSTR
ncbi:MAG: drug/metabolite transporter (DMT)-like permease [Verrucomicrobiales bacterium]